MNGLNITKSGFSVPDTVNRALTAIERAGGRVFTQIDHAEEARIKGLDLRPTALILFGNPNIGTKLMQDQQTTAIDLPLKLLVWQDEQEQTHIGYNSMDWLKKRHELTDDGTTDKIEAVLEEICSAATKTQ